MRLIDADALTRRVHEELHITNSRKDIIDLIDEAPTIVPIEDIKSCGVSADKSTDQKSADVPSGDIISRADAICAIENTDCELATKDWDELTDAIIALPSADRPTVIRSKTLMPTKDFKEWAKRVKETNPNVIVIPCDAEVVSAEPYREESEVEE